MPNRTTISITQEQHDKLEQVKEWIEEQAKENMALSQTGYSPSHVDALEVVMNKAEQAFEMEQSEEEDQTLPEDHPWHPSNRD